MLYVYLHNSRVNKIKKSSILKQKEMDLFVFLKIIELEYVKKDVFYIFPKLKITRQKARHLLYEYNLRLSANLEEKYKIFLKILFLKKIKML